MASVAPAQGLVGVRSQPRRVPLQVDEPPESTDGPSFQQFWEDYEFAVELSLEAGSATEDYRQGQIFFNLLGQRLPELADELRGSIRDPFHRDEVSGETWDWVFDRWEANGGVLDTPSSANPALANEGAVPHPTQSDMPSSQAILEQEEDWRGSAAEAAAVEALLPLERRILEIIIDRPSILVFDDPVSASDNIQDALGREHSLMEGGRAGPLRRNVEQIVESYYEGGYDDVVPALNEAVVDPVDAEVESPEARRGPSLAEQYGTVPPPTPTREPGYNYAGPRSERPAEETDLDRIIRIAESQGLNVESVVAEYHAKQADADYWAEVDAANVGQASASDAEVRRWMEGRNLEEAPRWTSEAGSSPSYGTEGTAGERLLAAEGVDTGIYPDPGFLPDVQAALQWVRDEGVEVPDPSVTRDQAVMRDRILHSLYRVSRPGYEGGNLDLEDMIDDAMRLTGADQMSVQAILNQAITRYRMSIEEEWRVQTGAEGPPHPLQEPSGANPSTQPIMRELETALRWAYEGAGDATRLGDVLPEGEGAAERFGPESHGDILDAVADEVLNEDAVWEAGVPYGYAFDSIEEVAEMVADIYGNTDAAQVASEIQTLLADYHGEMELERLEAEQAGAIAGETSEQRAERIVGEATGGFFDLTAPSTEPAAEYTPTPAELLQAETDDRTVAEANAAERYGERMVRVSLDPANPEPGMWVPWTVFVDMVNEQAQIVINETGDIASLEDIAGEIMSEWDTEQGGMTVTSLQGEAQIMEALVALAEAEMFPDTIVTEGVTYGERPTGEEEEGGEFPEGVHPAVTLYPPRIEDYVHPGPPIAQPELPPHTGSPIPEMLDPNEPHPETDWTPPNMLGQPIIEQDDPLRNLIHSMGAGDYQEELPLGDSRDTSGPSLGLTPEQRQRALEAITGLRGTLEDPPPQGTLEPLPEDPLPEPGPQQGTLLMEALEADYLAARKDPDFHLSGTEAAIGAAALLSGGASLMGPTIGRPALGAAAGLGAFFGGASPVSAETPTGASAVGRAIALLRENPPGPQSGRTDYTRMDTGAGIPAAVPAGRELTDEQEEYLMDNPPQFSKYDPITDLAFMLGLDELDWGDVGTFAKNPLGEALKAIGISLSDQEQRRQEEPPFRFPWEN